MALGTCVARVPTRVAARNALHLPSNPLHKHKYAAKHKSGLFCVCVMCVFVCVVSTLYYTSGDLTAQLKEGARRCPWRMSCTCTSTGQREAGMTGRLCPSTKEKCFATPVLVCCRSVLHRYGSHTGWTAVSVHPVCDVELRDRDVELRCMHAHTSVTSRQ